MHTYLSWKEEKIFLPVLEYTHKLTNYPNNRKKLTTVRYRIEIILLVSQYHSYSYIQHAYQCLLIKSRNDHNLNSRYFSTDFSNHAVHYAHINQLFKRVQRSARRVIPAHNHKRGIDRQRFQHAITRIKDRDR